MHNKQSGQDSLFAGPKQKETPDRESKVNRGTRKCPICQTRNSPTPLSLPPRCVDVCCAVEECCRLLPLESHSSTATVRRTWLTSFAPALPASFFVSCSLATVTASYHAALVERTVTQNGSVSAAVRCIHRQSPPSLQHTRDRARNHRPRNTHIRVTPTLTHIRPLYHVPATTALTQSTVRCLLCVATAGMRRLVESAAFHSAHTASSSNSRPPHTTSTSHSSNESSCTRPSCHRPSSHYTCYHDPSLRHHRRPRQPTSSPTIHSSLPPPLYSSTRHHRPTSASLHRPTHCNY